MKVSPYIELESVHVSKLSFHVSSWTNLRHSPICIDIEHVVAKIIEPLHFLDRRRRRPLRQITRHELAQLIRDGTVPKPRTGRYNLLDRIIDNLTVEIQSIDVTFQPLGKFKTRRPGPWTPPALRLQLFGVRLVSVTEFGHEASPDDVWRHNHRHHQRNARATAGAREDGSFLIYKKLSTEYKVSIVLSNQHDSENSNEIVIPISSSSSKDGICNNQSKVQVQLAFQRRIRDGEYLAVQVDTTIPVVHVEILATTIPHLAHLISAVTYLMAKDRAFDDPLRTVGSLPLTHAQATSPVIILQTLSSESSSPVNKEEVELTTASTVDVAMVDGLSESSDEDDNDGEDNDLNDNEKVEGELGDIIIEEEGLNGVQDELEIKAATLKSVGSVVSSAKPFSHRKPVPQRTVTSSRAPQSNDDRPVLVFPNGFILHDKVSISVSVHHVTIRGTYHSSVDGHIQIVANGVVAEAIWPQITKVRANSGD